VAKKRGRKGYPSALRQTAERRLARGENVRKLARELGVNWRTLYRWRDRFNPTVNRPEGSSAETEALQQKVQRLSQLLAEKTLEVDFFKGALQKVEARRQRKASSGEKTSTSKSVH
jgi:transposase-like protein